MPLPETPSARTPARRVDLDWLRIAAFGLLIFYHVGMFYVTWGWHVKSSRAGPAMEPLMLLVNPWRLTLLFLISGVATRFMLDKMRPGAFLGARSGRLLIPLTFGMFVIVPPQTWFQIVENLGYSGSVVDFYRHYVTASGDWRPGGERLITPTWNHLWFVAYLFVYSLLVIPIGPLLRRLPARFAAPVISGPLLILTPFLFLFAIRATLFPVFGETHALIDDWYNHALSFAALLFGYAIAKHEAFFEACQRLRVIVLVLAILAWAIPVSVRYGGLGGEALTGPNLALVGVALRELQAWCAIVAAIGFARRYLRHDGPMRRYLTDAIFPFYIIHQTAIVVAGYYLDRQHMPLWVEAPLLIVVTVSSCFATYEIARRISMLHPLFGLKVKPEDAGKRFANPKPSAPSSS
jgi:peptidoglycan/LPS O-acetylase OafA/YrhL